VGELWNERYGTVSVMGVTAVATMEMVAAAVVVADE